MRPQKQERLRYGLSPTQAGMLYHHLSGNRRGVDHEQIVCTLNEELDVDAFRLAWQNVVQRHESLRVRFFWRELAEPVQEPLPDNEVLFEIRDWRRHAPTTHKEMLASYLYEDRARGFDLSHAPAMRLLLVRTEASSYTCVWSFHHILLDGRSFPIVLSEVFRCYESIARGESPLLPTAPCQHRDFVEWLGQRDLDRSEDFWRNLLRGFRSPTPLIAPPIPSPGSGVDYRQVSARLSEATTLKLQELADSYGFTLNTIVQGSWAILLSRHSGERDVVFGATRAGRHGTVDGAERAVGVFINTLPIRIDVDPAANVVPWMQKLRQQHVEIRPHEHTPLVQVQKWSELTAGTPLFESLVVFDNEKLGTHLRKQGGAWKRRTFELLERTGYPMTLYANSERELLLTITYDNQRFSDAVAERTVGHLSTIIKSIADVAEQSLGQLPLLTAREKRRILVDWNDTRVDVPHTQIHTLFERYAGAHPERCALVFNEKRLSYGALNASANQLARRLRRHGVGPDVLVGVATDRSLEMVIAVLAVLKAGGAYLPLDPNYPSDRLGFMIEDSGIRVLITENRSRSDLPTDRVDWICIEDETNDLGAESTENLELLSSPEDLAYVIYTSGSTGVPKGVMVEHRNVVNFFSGMDTRVDGTSPGVWLAVTSLSFDISVLELLWTLCRGFQVVLQAEESDRRPATRTSQPAVPMDFSMFYFASHGDDELAGEKYRLIFESARFADEHDFVAVWSPERHFHAFGGLSPNPSILSGALAVQTNNVQVRSGSVVIPLHDPVRVVEDWALVDNLSNGRVALGVASGWFPNDFVLAPSENSYDSRGEVLFENVQTIRQLWRGETISRTNPLGDEVALTTLPRPIQKDLPIWVTAASNPETFRRAGEIGANVLTHLLGQSTERLTENIRIYREAWAAHNHPGDGKVSLMLHTFVGDNDEDVYEQVRKPMKKYLGSSVNLVQKYVSSLPIFERRLDIDVNHLDAGEVDAILEHSFERYFQTSGLFGSPDTCLATIDRFKEVGVNEIACLIDFGVDTDVVLDSLSRLDTVRRMANENRAAATIGSQVRRHEVTHLQCTPSHARLILADDDARAALGALERLMIGGEPFPTPLARRIQEHTDAELLNMYGPTETTIWSSTHEVKDASGGNGTVSIGRPVANTQFYVLDARLEPVPIGVAGELFIGGSGVVRGYLNRPELTEERFLPHPFEPGERIYRTGDRVRYREDGNVEFLGRLDHQVKLRGHRIELGEIESRLRESPEVEDAVVVVRDDGAGDDILIGYVISQSSQELDVDNLRRQLKRHLPAYMLPSRIILLDALPLTPNGKVDRNALPDPSAAAVRATKPEPESKVDVPPTGEMEEVVASVWCEVLSLPHVGANDNFFDLGGHSLLTVRVQNRLEEQLGRRIPITDLFRFSTVKSLAEYFSSGDSSKDELNASTEKRAALRKRARAARGRLRRH